MTAVRWHCITSSRVRPLSSRPKTSASVWDALYSSATPAGVAELFAESQTLALVFGREDSGLTREEVVQCQRTASIPTHPDFPTMNLAQSVGVFCYELSPVERRAQARELAPAALIERLHERAEALLLEVGFLQANNPDRIYDDLRAIAARADLDAREATIALGIISQVEWALKR